MLNIFEKIWHLATNLSLKEIRLTICCVSTYILFDLFSQDPPFGGSLIVVREQKKGGYQVKITTTPAMLYNISEFRTPHQGPNIPFPITLACNKNKDKTERDKKSYHSALSKEEHLYVFSEIFTHQGITPQFSFFLHFFFIFSFLFGNNYRVTGSCKDSTERFCVSFTQFPSVVIFYIKYSTISKPGN